MDVRGNTDLRPRGNLLRRGYPVVVTAAACMLLVLLAWPAAPGNYLAEATAVVTGPHPPNCSGDDVLAWLRADEVLEAALANLRHREAASADLPPTPEALRQRLHLARLDSPDEMPRLAIGSEGSSRGAAQAMADELASQVVEHYGEQRRHQRSADVAQRQQVAISELRKAEADEERLKVQLEGLRHAQLTSALTANSTPAPPAASSAAPPPTEVEPTPSDVARQLAMLKTERERLLEVFLPAHPQIQALSAQISRLEESLKQYEPEPEDLPGPSSRLQGRKVLLQWRRGDRTHALANAEDSAPDHSDPSLTAAIQQAQIALINATQRRHQAQAAALALEQEGRSRQNEGTITWTVEPAQIVDVVGGSPRWQLLVALMAAGSGGLAMAWLTRSAERNRVLSSIGDLQATLALPVLGTVPSSAAEPTAPLPASATQSAVRQATRCAEAVLLTFVVTLLAAAAFDRQLLGDLLSDPVATLGGFVRRLL